MRRKSLIVSLVALFSFLIFSQNAYAAYSASISRTSSEAVALSDDSGSGTIKPSYAGTLGTGSDVVTISSNCSAGYNLYVSAISGGSTNLSISGGTDYIPSTTTTTGSEATLSKDTWGIGKDGITFSKLQSYSEDLSSLSPLYIGSGNKDYTIYYGVNVSTSKTPGTYTGDVLYTVLMNSACVNYTIDFNGNGATMNKLESIELEFDSTLDLSTISTTDKIAKTGYHLTGWQDQDGNSYGITGTVDINPNDKSTVTLTAMWEANTYTIKYNAGSTGGTCNAADTLATYDQNVTLSSTKCTKSGAEQKGWSTNQSGSPKTYDLGETLEKPNLTAEDKGTFPLYPYFESTVPTDDGNKGNFQTAKICSSIGAGHTATLTDARDNQTYTVYRWPNSGTAGTDYPTSMSGYCIMTKDLSLGYVTGGSVTKGKNLSLTTANSNFDTNASSSTYESFTLSGTQTVTARTGKSDWSTTNSYTNKQYINGSGGTYDSHTYYSWGAALVVCPKGWRLPTGDEYRNIATFMGGKNSTGSATIRGTPYNFIYNGDFSASDGWYTIGSYGYYWPPDQYSKTYSYIFLFNSSGLSLAGTNYYRYGKNYGRAVRCIATP